MNEVRNAKVKSTHLGPEDHGIMSAMLNLDYGGAGQGFGGYDLRGNNTMHNFVKGVLKATGAGTWEKVTGAMVQVRIEGGIIRAIRPILSDSEADWFVAASIYEG